jgi:DNA polymerase-3 subunit gamma/tau
MSEVLYRKYRPKKFDDVIGQDQIISVLKQSIKDGSIGHAYLFFGGRGTGKTTIARIFAEAIGTTAVDCYEIDAASNRGIDDVRELREAVRTPPFESQYKVYIIDEVHMLTKEAFNALLKTLEEPPKHVVFILATTEKEKLPDTVISRCQTFTFRQPSIEVLKKHVLDIAKKEGSVLDAPGAELVALFGDGSFRDTLSVLEKVLVTAQGKNISVDDVAQLIGAPKSEMVMGVLRAIDQHQIEMGLTMVRKAEEEQIDMKVFMKIVLQHIRSVLLLRYAPTMEQTFREEFTPDTLLELKQYAKGNTINSHILLEFLEAYKMLNANLPLPALPLELALMKTVGETAK